MTFRVGQDVVCINDAWGYPGVHPKEGCVYKIAAIEPPIDRDRADAYLRFAGCDYAYDRRHFRPAVQPKQEISFTIGAPKDSKQWDGRRKVRERV